MQLFFVTTRKVKHQDNNVDGTDELETKIMEIAHQEVSWLQRTQENRGIFVPGNH